MTRTSHHPQPDASTPRALFNQVMRFQCPGRTLATLGGIWPSTLARWASEGMPASITGVGALLDYLGLQPHLWGGPQAELFTYPPFDYRVVRETATTVTYINPMGITCTDFRVNAYQSMPHFEAFPVRSRADWEAYQPRLQWDDVRVGEAWIRQKAGSAIAPPRSSSRWDAWAASTARCAISSAWRHCPCSSTTIPELVAEVMDTVTALFLHACDALFSDFIPDAVCLWEDMAYKTSSLLGIAQVREFMLPRYRVMTAKLREKGVPIILLDSDGHIEQLIPIWLEAGIDGVVPMEAQAGMDVAVYRERYPRLLMMGGVDKKALAAGKAAIDQEIDKIARVTATGGLIPFFDHGLPHDVSYANFLYFVERLKEVCGYRS